MNHWDLIPHETVTLVGGRVEIRVGFRFRDTTRAYFLIDEKTTAELWLLPDGNLEERTRIGTSFRSRIWRIAEERKDSRTLLARGA